MEIRPLILAGNYIDVYTHLDVTIHKGQNGIWNYDQNVTDLEQTVKRSKEKFIKHFVDNHSERLPPLWAVCEIMTLGQLSRWYTNLQSRTDRNNIAKFYGLDEVILSSFLHHLSIIRNICAHHGRLWNRELSFTLKIPKRQINVSQSINHSTRKRIYNSLVMLAYLMDKISQNKWKQKIDVLFNKHPHVDNTHMGFPEDWKDRPIWETLKSGN